MPTIIKANGAGHWYAFQGTHQECVDHLNSNRIPDHSVRGFTGVVGTNGEYTVLYSKGK